MSKYLSFQGFNESLLFFLHGLICENLLNASIFVRDSERHSEKNPPPFHTALHKENKKAPPLEPSRHSGRCDHDLISGKSTFSAVVLEDGVTLKLCLVLGSTVCKKTVQNLAKRCQTICLHFRERDEECGLISSPCDFLLVFLFEFVVSQRGLDGVLCEHCGKINTVIRQGLDNSPTV